VAAGWWRSGGQVGGRRRSGRRCNGGWLRSGERSAAGGVRSTSAQWLVWAGGRGHEQVGVGEN
jgi:hypothetical protein